MPPDITVIEAEAIQNETVQEVLLTFKAQDLFVPEFEMPEVKIEPPKEVVVVPANTKQQLGQPPVTITKVYPQKGSGLGYKGYVSIAATIGKDGKVRAIKLSRSISKNFPRLNDEKICTYIACRITDNVDGSSGSEMTTAFTKRKVSNQLCASACPVNLSA